MTIFIIGKTFQTAKVKMQEIIEEIPKFTIINTRISRDSYFVTLYDGTLYEAKLASQNLRGYRIDAAFIDSEIEDDLIWDVIKPILICSKLPKIFRKIYFKR